MDVRGKQQSEQTSITQLESASADFCTYHFGCEIRSIAAALDLCFELVSCRQGGRSCHLHHPCRFRVQRLCLLIESYHDDSAAFVVSLWAQ